MLYLWYMYSDMARRKRFTIEVYEEEMQLLHRMKVRSTELGAPFRDFAMQAIKEKLEREGAPPPAPPKKK